MKKNIMPLASIVIFMLLIVSCKKDDGDRGTKAVFSYVADGFVVNFTNFSTEATEYIWEFGDGTGETSTRRSPQYIYKAKGDYLVSLTAKNGDLTSTFIDTVTIIGPNIKIDGDFTDWQFVDYSHINEEGQGGTLRAIKTFASATHLNFLLEGTADMELEVMVLYLNTDRNPESGYMIDWLYPLGSGANYYLDLSMTGGWGNVLQHSGNPADAWGGFTPIAYSEIFNYSEIKTTETNGKRIEFSIDRALLASMSGSVGYTIIDNSGRQIGSLPANGHSDSKFATFPL